MKDVFEHVIDLLNNPQAHTSWVCRAEGGKIVRMTRIVVLPRTRKRRNYRVAVTDWGDGGAPAEGKPRHAYARGCDLTQATAAAGATIGGVECGYHCDSKGRQTITAIINTRHKDGWECIGSVSLPW